MYVSQVVCLFRGHAGENLRLHDAFQKSLRLPMAHQNLGKLTCLSDHLHHDTEYPDREYNIMCQKSTILDSSRHAAST